MGGDLRPMTKLYHMCVKALLGVRGTTSNDLCLVELGLPDLPSLVRAKQRAFFKKIQEQRRGMVDDPLNHAMQLTLNARTPTSRHLHALLQGQAGDEERSLAATVATIVQNPRESTRLQWYSSINTNYDVHDIYLKDSEVNELHRVSWTRLRLSSHSLAIEQGRWNRRGRGRLPVEERLCTCGQVQTEHHVIEACPRTEHLRVQHRYTTVTQLMNIRDNKLLCKICHNILQVYTH